MNKNIKIFVIFSKTKHEFEVKLNEKIGEAIQRFVSENSPESVENIRFVGMGKFLDENKTFEEEGVKNETLVRAFKSLSGKQSQEKKPSIGQTQTQSQTSPQPQSNANQFNPYNMNMMDNNPSFSNINPSMINNHLDQVLADPNLLDVTIQTMMPNASASERETFKASFVENIKRMKENPGMMDMMTNQMRNMMQGGGSGGMNFNPYGFNPMMNPGMTNPMANQMNSPMNNRMNSPVQNPMYNNMMNQGMRSPYHYDYISNQSYQMSPTVPCSHGFYPMYFQNMFNDHMNRNMGTASTPKKEITEEEAEQKYSEQLSSMYSMGYTNKKKNINALIKCGGNLQAAVNYILDNVGNDE